MGEIALSNYAFQIEQLLYLPREGETGRLANTTIRNELIERIETEKDPKEDVSHLVAEIRRVLDFREKNPSTPIPEFTGSRFAQVVADPIDSVGERGSRERLELLLSLGLGNQTVEGN